ncbi:MAG TPA: VOC family protein [Candidatus Binataceae bacterium]|nr:VOC family protein [Candidatus Binataceae bacterium]
MKLNHTIVPAHDKRASARFLARLFNLPVRSAGHFEVVEINPELTLDYDEREDFSWHHYAFAVSDEEFDAIFARVQQEGLEYAADPMFERRGEINRRRGGRGFYFHDPNGHNFEVLTRA